MFTEHSDSANGVLTSVSVTVAVLLGVSSPGLLRKVEAYAYDCRSVAWSFIARVTKKSGSLCLCFVLMPVKTSLWNNTSSNQFHQ